MIPRRLAFLAAILCLLGMGAAWAHVELLHPGNGRALRWKRPDRVSVVISSRGSDDLPEASSTAAIRQAVRVWNGVPGTRARLREVDSPGQRARDDWRSGDLHLLAFDEANESGFFPPGGGAVAVTPIWYWEGGRIADADVLFNGRYRFTTSGAPGAFDVQDIATHELGHLLGFDHSGWAGSSLYPYVFPGQVLHRSLSLDEEQALRSAYPEGSHASLSGRVLREGSAEPIAGAHLLARDANGRPVGASLSAADGSFELRGLEPGVTSLVVGPLDSPVGVGNLSSGQAIQTDFGARLFGAGSGFGAPLEEGEARPLGELFLPPDALLNVGLKVDRYPLRVVPGEAVELAVRGTRLQPGVLLRASDPQLVLTTLAFAPGGFRASFLASSGLELAYGHVDLEVEDADGNLSVLPAAFEVTPPDPALETLSATRLSIAGGELLTLGGAGFRPGAVVVLGGALYPDGEGARVLSPELIQLETRPMEPGPKDLWVVDPSGLEAHRPAALEAVDAPVLEGVFPAAIQLGGGTRLRLTGRNFDPGARVFVAGVEQPLLRAEADFLEVQSAPLDRPGEAELRVQHPNGEESACSLWVSSLADPRLEGIEPPRADRRGGAWVTLHGDHFDEHSRVRFGVDPRTGMGGREAEALERVDAQTLRVRVPAHPPGRVAVLVSREAPAGTLASGEPVTQAALFESGFTFEGEPSGGGGGCAGALSEGAGGGAGPAWLALPAAAFLASLLLGLRARGVLARLG